MAEKRPGPQERISLANLKEVTAISESVFHVMEKGDVDPRMGAAATAYALGMQIGYGEATGVFDEKAVESLLDIVKGARAVALAGAWEIFGKGKGDRNE